LRAVYEKCETQLEPEKGLLISERPSWVMPPWQTLKESVLYLQPDEAVQLCRSLRFRGAYLYYVAQRHRISISVQQQSQAIAEASTCLSVNAELIVILYAIEHARYVLRKTAHI
jgi:hypothetical protein